MHKPLPVLFVLVIVTFWSCKGPSAETASATADNIPTDSLPPDEDPANDTAYNGDTQGDFFFNDTSKAIINGDTTFNDDEAEEDDEERMVSIHEPTIDACGFSADGNYFAFTQVVPGDPNGGEGSVFIIDVVKNKWAIKPGNVETPDEDVSALLEPVRNTLLSKYNIQYHKSPGTHYDLKGGQDVVTGNGKKWRVILEVDGLLINLHAKSESGQDIVLQEDKVVPRTRGSARRYRLNKAYVLGDKIAVFVEYDSEIMRDYENYQYYDRKNIVVTGILR